MTVDIEKMDITTPSVKMIVTNNTATEKDPRDSTDNTAIGDIEAKKKDFPGDEPIGPVTNPPSPCMLQAYVRESKPYLSGVSDLQIWKDLVDIWVQFENNCPQRGVRKKFPIHQIKTDYLACWYNSLFRQGTGLIKLCGG